MSTDQGTGASAIAGRYELRQRVGSGGSGEVWLAEDRELNRRVAVKRVEIPRGLPDDERERARARVLREARAAASIDHPNVVRVYDVLDDDDAVAIIMAYVDAPNLEELVSRQGPLADEQAAAIGEQILDALEAAHAQGVVHRDIKPSNVLLHDDGAKLTDFGIAAVADGTNLTRTGTALGSPGFIAPEQASGDEAAASADIWGLGATLYYAVEGKPPFDRGRAVATLHAVVHDAPDDTTSGSALLPVIGELLEKDPARRPELASARQLVTEHATATVAIDESSPTRTQRLPTEEQPAHSPEAERSTQDQGPDDRTRAVAGRDLRDEVGDRSGQSGSRPRTEPDDDRTGKLVGTIFAMIFLAVVAGLVWLFLGTSDDPEETDLQAQTTETSAPNTGEEEDQPGSTGAGDEPAERATATSTPTAQDTAPAEVPEGWQRFDGPVYSVAHPADWQPQEGSGPRIDLTDPQTGTYLRLDYTDDPEPDPVADWEQASDDFAQRYGNYEEIRIEAVDYRDFDAALWEYSYVTDGQRFHAYNLGFTDGECGWALNLQAPESAWSEMEPKFEQFMATFEPQGC